MKFHDMGEHGGEQFVAWYCPGCKGGHEVPVTGPRKWGFNGNYESPTLSPSVLVNRGGANPTVPVCHATISDGEINFLSDCTHKLAEQVVEVPEWE